MLNPSNKSDAIQISDSPPFGDDSQSDDVEKEALFQHFHKKVNCLLASNLPGMLKTFEEYLEATFENSNSMDMERMTIQKHSKSKASCIVPFSEGWPAAREGDCHR